MEKSNLFELLKTLGPAELNGFASYAANPFFKKGDHHAAAERLLKLYTEAMPGQLDKAVVSEAVFPGKAFSAVRVEKAMVELLKLLKQFLLIGRQLGEENRLAAELDFVRELIDRKLLGQAAKVARSAQHSFQQITAPTMEDYGHGLRLGMLLRELEMAEGKWKDARHIEECLCYLDLFYFANRFDLLNQALAMRTIVKGKSAIDFDKERRLIELLDIGPADSASVYMLKQIFEAYNSAIDQAAFYRLCDLLTELSGQLDITTKAKCLAFVKSYGMKLIERGHAGLWPKILELQKYSLIILKDSNLKLNPGSFINTAIAGAKAGEFEWTHQFMESYKDQLNGENENRDVYRLAMASFLFTKGDFGAALDFIPSASASPSLHHAARSLELMVFYETGSELLPYKMDAFKMHLTRAREKDLSFAKYTTNNNFLNLLKQIVASRPGDASRKETLFKRIAEKKDVAARDWLLEKARKL